MGKQKSAQKLTLRYFHDQIDNGYGFSDFEIVSMNEEDEDFPVVATDNKVQEAIITSMVTIDVWPKLGSVDPSPGLKSSAKATEYGGVTKTPPQGPTARNLSVVAQTHLVQEDKSGGRANAWTNRKILVKNGKLSKHLKKFPIVYENGQLIRSWAQWVWKIGPEDVVTLDNGFFVFSFRDASAMDYILENGPYFCGGKRIVIKQWHPGMHLTKGAFSSVPVWVKLYNVPLESWTEVGLSYIGNPLYLDEFTQDHSRLTFAHVCIEVEAAKEIPNQPQSPPSQVWKAKETVGQKVPVVKERIAKERVGQVVSVVQERAAKEREDGDHKDECVEVKRKKAKRTPLAISSSLCVSSTANEVGVLERCEDSGASAIVKVTNKDDAGTVPPLVVLYPVTGVSTPVVQGWGSHQQKLPPVVVCRSTRFREPPRIPLEGDFIGPHQS
ncbi:hypothetical protein RHSIM_Rhsim12G0195300 [Rhododendron simsii]|uniref:DUF4283 domain-containing protein n=1 Tax=Rhododendron simsii TaxID=118357 RepID=A0A834G2N7_RHOSS|nr:hypothetical protein RHSIM_Rhsim12G0195300 [Rhododendron simsii]